MALTSCILDHKAMIREFDMKAKQPATAKQAAKQAYDARHYRVKRVRGPASAHQCVRCPAQARDWAQIHTEDGEDPWADYVPLCKSCHLVYDQSGHRKPHTEAAKARMSAAHREAFASGRRTPSRHNAGREKCPSGHDYDEANTYRRPDGGRDCKTCMRRRTRESRARKREGGGAG